MADPTLSLSGREGRLIDLITRVVPTAGGEFGPGDDCARLGGGTDRVVTTDTMIEGTHFLRSHPAEWLGWKVLATNLSDVAAMGAVSTGFTLSVAVPRTLPEPWWQRFANGMAECARWAEVQLVGGDIVASPGPLVATVTCWGELRGGTSLRRCGATPGDLVWVVGHIGRSAAGLEQWLAMNRVEEPTKTDETPTRPWPISSEADAWSTEPLLRAHLRPEPPLNVGPQALRLGATAGMDLSDGLWLDAARLAMASDLSIVLDEELLPADDSLADVPALTRIAGGEDYSLLLTGPESLRPALGPLGAHPVGQCIPKRGESQLLLKRSDTLVEIGEALAAHRSASQSRRGPFQHFTE